MQCKQLWGYKFQEKLYLGVREQKTLNITGLEKFVTLDTTPPAGNNVVLVVE
jgi:hypothetical protein